MEKFGIFELLDTLSALLPQDGEKKNAEEGEKSSPNVKDAAFSPPSYAAEPKTAEDAALSSFLSRHDEIARRVDKKK